HYPKLSAAQVKMVIEKASQKPADKVKNPGNDEMVPLTYLSRAGGVVNAFEAIKLASTIKGERNTAPVKPIKSTVKPKTKG
nr:peptidase S8 [Chitinophagaceae bacterium]